MDNKTFQCSLRTKCENPVRACVAFEGYPPLFFAYVTEVFRENKQMKLVVENAIPRYTRRGTLMGYANKPLTAKELLRTLEKQPDDLPVVLCYTTESGRKLRATFECVKVRKSLTAIIAPTLSFFKKNNYLYLISNYGKK